MSLKRFPVWIVERLKRAFGCKTWHIESAFVLIVLSLVALFTHKGPTEWIGVLAVWFTFLHASVSNRLEEAALHRELKDGVADVHCHRWSARFFLSKELCWFLYFAILGAWSALVGAILFLLYQPWRKLWRTYHPNVR